MEINLDSCEYFLLSNGLRAVIRQHNSPVEFCGLAINAGSRNENPDEYGLAHFVEHTIFKGTTHRKSWHIINRMESVGGELNAYTSEEVTMVYSAYPAGNTARAMELISDLITDSNFPTEEIDRERDVILDELNSYLDTPSDAIFDDFNDLIFAGSSLGHNILGNEETIRSFSSRDCRNFLDRFYVPDNMVVFYMGPGKIDKIKSIIERYFSKLSFRSRKPEQQVPEILPPFDRYRSLDTHQAHTVIGARVPGMYDNSKFTYALLNNILGGPCMNSRLNVILRERNGLVYSVDSCLTSFTDCGVMTIYFGCDKEDVKRCRKLIFDTIDRLANYPLTSRTLDAAKKQYLGQLVLGKANQEQIALGTARATLFHNRVAEPDIIKEHITSITPLQLQEAAATISASCASILTFG